MPIYEYTCQKCGHHLEVMQKMSDKPLSKCPECKGKLEKIFSQTSFQLKGSGWYVSDYARSGKTEKADKGDKVDKVEKTDKSDKVDKVDKVEKTDKADKVTKTDKKEPVSTA
jgi:putative FmdB family regulatory protein